MPRQKDTPCSRCGTLTWWHSRDSKPKELVVCRSCRRAASVPYAGRTVSASDQLQRMLTGALTLREKVCECGKTFQGVARRMLCDGCRSGRRSVHTRKKNAVRQSRASGRMYLDTGELITIRALGDRDKWTCWICDEFVNWALGNRDPWMPSFDHVKPISLGGLDSWDNLRLAHLSCNVKRGNRVMA